MVLSVFPNPSLPIYRECFGSVLHHPVHQYIQFFTATLYQYIQFFTATCTLYLHPHTLHYGSGIVLHRMSDVITLTYYEPRVMEQDIFLHLKVPSEYYVCIQFDIQQSNLISKAKSVCLCVCVRYAHTHFLLHCPQTRCGCWGHRGSGYSGVDSAHLAIRRELSVHFRFSFTDDRLFLIIVPVDFRFLTDLIGCRPTVEFKRIIINLSYSSNMAAEGIGRQAPGEDLAEGRPLCW